MSEKHIFIPIPRKLYDDIVRFSDGRLDPVVLAQNTLENWVVNDLGDLFGEDHWVRWEEAAEIYAPHLLERLEKERGEVLARHREESKPLVWKEVSISAGSEVRMAYSGTHHYAKVERGCIMDDGKEYSPSEWASKVAGGTSRNAWRDLWFRERLSQQWASAQRLRDQARQEATVRSNAVWGAGANEALDE